MGKKHSAESVRVAAAARLHLGFLDLNGSLDRRFGSIGVGVKGLSVTLEVRPGKQVRVSGADNGRIADLTQTILDYFRIDSGVEVEVRTRIPPHRGLGSGTQTSLALGTAITRLYGVDASVEEIAVATGRGGRSGIGLGVFKHGGFILDSGRGAGQALPTIILRHDFPGEWRFVLIFDEQGQGLSGAAEREAFRALPDIPDETAGEACRLVLMQTLPGLMEKDCEQFGRSISGVQAGCGEYFRQIQGGLFTSENVRQALGFLLENKATGGGQTSWGPTGFAVFPDEQSALQAMDNFAGQGRGNNIRLQLAEAENSGARISGRQATREQAGPGKLIPCG